jgi:Zn-dependent protease
MTAVYWGLVSVVMHECGHLFVAWALGSRIKGIVFDRHGIGVRREGGSPLCMFLSALAGPMVNIVLAVLFWNIPPAVASNGVMAILNLLPMPYSDGQRALDAMRIMSA